jgi:2-octaprenyl-6-methoxyphenol hydroxylase
VLTEYYDIVVVGAGLAGSSLAGALALLSDKKIAVLERSLPQAITDPSPDSRPISLNYGSQQALATLGWWGRLAPQATAIRAVQVSQQGRLGVVDFKADDFHLPALGYVIPYDYLHQQLYEVTAGSSQVDFIQVSAIESVENQTGRTTITLQSGQGTQQLCAQLLVVADGAQSDCCDLLGIRVNRESSGKVALSGELKLSSVHHNRALQRFCKQGVIAVLPLSDPYRARFVLTLEAEHHNTMQTFGRSRWLQFWQDALRGYLLVESVKWSGELSLQIHMAQEIVRPGVVIIGNAAHTLYPLAAQGFNLTFRDVAALVELLIDAMIGSPTDWASASVLQNYANWRDKDARQLNRFTSGLQSLFELRLPGLGHLRGLGLIGLDMMPGGKKALCSWLMGLGGKVPKLMRGVFFKSIKRED